MTTATRILNKGMERLKRGATATVTAEVERITPDWCKDALERMASNRPRSRILINFISQQLRDGLWKVNGETIVWNWDDLMMDGQHRCIAGMETGIAFDSVVVRGVDPAAFPTIDTGTNRRLADVLGMMGEKNAKILAVAIRTLWVLNSGSLQSFKQRLNHVSALNVFEAHGSLRKSVQFVMDNDLCSVMSLGYSAAFFYACAQKDRQLATSFWSRLGTGESLVKDEPVYTLRRRLLRSRKEPDEKLHRDVMMAIVIRAWNCTRRGEQLTNMRVGKDDWKVAIE